MKIADVVNQLQLLLPKFTNRVSSVLTISSISVSSNVATITTSSAHGLRTGQAAALSNVVVETPISAESKSANTYTFTATNHDLTFGWEDHETITMSGFTDGDWNDTFTLGGAPNRNTFTIVSANSEPVLNGNEVLHEIRSDGINGRFSITVVDTTSFTITGSFLDGDYSGGTVSSGVRVAGAITLERAIEEYTEQSVSDLWIFVVMNDADVSKDRSTFSDATATRTGADDIRIRLIDGFTVTIVVNTSNDITATDALDLCRHDLLQPILKTIYGARFSTGLDGDADFRTVLTGHGFSSYNRAILAYTFGFEVVMDLTAGDSVNEGDTRAYRNIDYTQTVGDDDTTDATISLINLDDSP